VVTLADTAARTLFSPLEIPVGIFMSFIGGPFFLYLLKRRMR
jgi:iron complex transport system permease protein